MTATAQAVLERGEASSLDDRLPTSESITQPREGSGWYVITDPDKPHLDSVDTYLYALNDNKRVTGKTRAGILSKAVRNHQESTNQAPLNMLLDTYANSVRLALKDKGQILAQRTATGYDLLLHSTKEGSEKSIARIQATYHPKEFGTGSCFKVTTTIPEPDSTSGRMAKDAIYTTDHALRKLVDPTMQHATFTPTSQESANSPNRDLVGYVMNKIFGDFIPAEDRVQTQKVY